MHSTSVTYQPNTIMDSRTFPAFRLHNYLIF